MACWHGCKWGHHSSWFGLFVVTLDFSWNILALNIFIPWNSEWQYLLHLFHLTDRWGPVCFSSSSPQHTHQGLVSGMLCTWEDLGLWILLESSRTSQISFPLIDVIQYWLISKGRSQPGSSKLNSQDRLIKVRMASTTLEGQDCVSSMELNSCSALRVWTYLHNFTQYLSVCPKSNSCSYLKKNITKPHPV